MNNDGSLDARRSQILVDSRVAQSQLEGLFRKMYQACTQEAYISQLALYRSTIEKSLLIHQELELMADEMMSMAQSEQKDETNVM